jgi:adenosylmethionine-8-amino-7-oxononanoate aminotransferase
MSSTHCRNDSAITPEKGVQVPPLPPRPTSILHRTPWQPPVAVSGQGIYITLEDGREVIDAVGGAAVACIGNGHPVVREAIKEQVDKLACEWPSQFRGHEYGFHE